jgi:hypothetical protein
MTRVPVVALALLAMAAGVAAQGGARPLPNAGPPLLLKLEGVIQPSKAAATGIGFTVTSFAFLGGKSQTERWLGVTKARTVGGDQPLDGKDVLAVVAPFTPNFLVVGPKDLVAQLRDAPPGTAVRIEGLVNRGSRTYFLRRVERDVPGVG